MARKANRVRGLAIALTVVVLAAWALPTTAWAYFNRGSVEVSLGASSVEVAAGETVSVSVTLTPASDEQLEGCGMALCPQLCSEDCLDENGQCTCLGTEYATYYASAQASSSDTSVAVAVYDGGTLTIYGKQAGTATITVTASLRQFTDGEATLTVTVTGTAEDTESASDAVVEVPDEADVTSDQEDRADVVDKQGTRLLRYVRINDAMDVEANLAEFAGVDGDLTFWSGDTYYYPDYSVTVTGTDYDEDDVCSFDPTLEVSTQATGALSQLLGDLDEYVVVDFVEEDGLPCAVTVYALASGVFSEDDEVALYSYDEATKSFVLEDAEAIVVGDYVAFTVDEAKTYAVSTHDLTTEAASVIEADAEAASAVTTGDEGTSGAVPPLVFAAVAIVGIAVVALAVVAVALRRVKRQRKDEVERP